MASESIRYTMRYVASASLMRNSWHRSPITGMGLECGIPSISPLCNRRSRYPASTLAAWEKGGVLISPCNQTRGLSLGLTEEKHMSDLTCCQLTNLTFRFRPIAKATAELYVSHHTHARLPTGSLTT